MEVTMEALYINAPHYTKADTEELLKKIPWVYPKI